MRKFFALFLAAAVLVAALGGPPTPVHAQEQEPHWYMVEAPEDFVYETVNKPLGQWSAEVGFTLASQCGSGDDLRAIGFDVDTDYPSWLSFTATITAATLTVPSIYANTAKPTYLFVDSAGSEAPDYVNAIRDELGYVFSANAYVPGPNTLESSGRKWKFEVSNYQTASYFTPSNLRFFCYGDNDPAYTPPTTNTCINSSITRTFDLLTDATLTAGSLELEPRAGTSGIQTVHELDATFSLDLPTSTITGLKNGHLYAVIDFADVGEVDIEAVINGVPSVVKNVDTAALNNPSALPGIDVLIPGGADTLTIHVTGESLGPLPQQLIGLKLKSPMSDACAYNILNDGGMEYPDDEPNPYWGLSTDGAWADYKFSRIFNTDILQAMLNGGSACQQGYQVVGIAYLTASGAPIYQPFTWPGGTAYWKARYRSYRFSGYWPVPHMFVTDQSGAVYDLIGNGTVDYQLYNPKWALVTGSVSLPAGEYTLYLDMGAEWEGTEKKLTAGRVSWDDIAIGSIPQSSDCDEIDTDIPPDMPTPTPSPTPTVTPTGPTRTPTVTATVTRTTRPTYTALPGTNTPRPTVTRTVTATRNAATLTAQVPTSTKTPYGYVTPFGTAVPGPSATPGGPTGTPGVPGGEPVVGDWWRGRPGQPSGGGGGPYGSPATGCDNPAPVVYTEGDWTGIPENDCSRPTGWGMDYVTKWIDYQVCSTTSFVTWGPIQQATAQAIPCYANQYEPFGSISELADGYRGMRTQVASYPWSQTGVDGVNDGVSPLTFLRAPGMPDAWAVGAKPFNFIPGSEQSSVIIEGEQYFTDGGENADVSGLNANSYALVDTNVDPGNVSYSLSSSQAAIAARSYASYCNMQLSSLFSGNLARGACYALGFARKVGMLPWVQFFINIASIVTIFRAFLAIVNMAPTAATTEVIIQDTKE